MALLKANEALPERPVVIGYYGEPGVKKTSIAHTADTPLLIDFDRGVGRSYGRKDAILVDNWEEVLKYEQEGLFKNYKTIIIDTAKAALDDFLMTYVVKLDYKNQKNKLQAYGAIGDEFKRFVNQLRNDGTDVVIIAHSKKDEDTKKLIPDVTGQSYNLILRIADQIGYVSTKNNKSVIQWTPTDTTVGKNTAGLAEVVIPEKNDPAFKNFMSTIIRQVKASIVTQSEEQREALEKSEAITKEIDAAESFDDLSLVLSVIAELPAYLQQALMQTIRQKVALLVPAINTVDGINSAVVFLTTKPMQMLKSEQEAIKKIQQEKGWLFDKDKKIFFSPVPTKEEYSKDLKKEIPGASLTDEVKNPELAFSE